MTLTVGRCGYDVTLPEPRMCDLQGNTLRLGGFLEASTVADVLTLRQQLLGLADSPDEPVIAITWSIDATINGYYRVQSISVIPGHFAAFDAPANAAFVWEGEFERVTGFGVPAAEMLVQVPGLTNAHGVTSTEYTWVVGLPIGITDFYGAGFDTTYRFRDGADGNVPILWNLATTPQSNSALFSSFASTWYQGACKLQIGSSLRTMVGRQVEASHVGSAFDGWRLDNGLVRVTWVPASDRFDIAHHDGTSWQTAKGYNIGRVPSNPIQSAVSFRVLHNTPERVTVRLGMSEAATPYSSPDFGTPFTVDLTIRRGVYAVSIVISVPAGVVVGVQRSTAEAATATQSTAPFTSAAGLRATATDADGNRYMIVTNLANSRDLVQGRVVTSGSVTEAQFWVTLMPNYATITSQDDEQQQITQVFSGASEVINVVAR